MIKNKIFVFIFRAFAFLLAVWGIMVATGVFKHAFNPITLLAYTVQSNILVAVFFGILLVKTMYHIFGKANRRISLEKHYGFFPRLSFFVTLAIFVTMVIYWLILVPVYFHGMNELLTLGNLTIHLFTPLLMLADHIMFTERGKLKKYDPLRIIVIPYIYLVEAISIGLTHRVRYDSLGIHSYYPYIFLDIDKFGAWVILMVAAITIFFVVLAFIWKYFDNKIAMKKM